MTEETKILWQFIFDGMTAIGTVGAVVISLVASLWRKPSFKIHAVEISGTHTLNNEHKVENEEYDLLVKIENKLDVQMQIFNVALRYTLNLDGKPGLQGSGTVYPQTNIYIPPHSQNFVKVPLQRNWDEKSCTNARRIECEVSTSFGDKIVEFPKNRIPQLSNAIEKRETVNK